MSDPKSAFTVHTGNNFDAIRIVAALVVIFGHAHSLSATPDDVILGNAVQTIAVKIFFVVSGFLVARSWQSDPHVYRYLLRRGLRLFPGLALVLFLTIFVLGPLVTEIPLHAYFHDAATSRYFFYNIVLYPIYNLPGVFTHSTFPNAVNGSLWSLPAEVAMYVLLPVAFLTTVIDRSTRLTILVSATVALLMLLYVSRAPPDQMVVFWGTGARSVADVGSYFLVGALYSGTSLRRWLSAPVALLLVGAIALFHLPDDLMRQIALLMVLPYATLSFAVHAVPGVCKAGRFGDPSYGIYVYAFPVQQTLFHFSGPAMGPLENAFIASMISITLGYASWHLVEKRALAFKPKKEPTLLTNKSEEVTNS